MKIITIILLISCILTSCIEEKNEKGEYIKTNPDIVRYDGCQYIRFSYNEYAWGSHSGTCDNPIHNNK